MDIEVRYIKTKFDWGDYYEEYILYYDNYSKKNKLHYYLYLKNTNFRFTGSKLKLKDNDEIIFKNISFNNYRDIEIESELINTKSKLTKDNKYEIFTYTYLIFFEVDGKKRKRTLHFNDKKPAQTKEYKEYKRKQDTYNKINQIFENIGVEYRVNSEITYKKFEKILLNSDLKRIFKAPYRKDKIKNILKD